MLFIFISRLSNVFGNTTYGYSKRTITLLYIFAFINVGAGIGVIISNVVLDIRILVLIFLTIDVFIYMFLNIFLLAAFIKGLHKVKLVNFIYIIFVRFFLLHSVF